MTMFDYSHINSRIFEEIAKEYLEDKYHKKPVLLYGGSIDDSNIKDIINIPTIDGVLLGDISSDIRVVEKVVEEIN